MAPEDESSTESELTPAGDKLVMIVDDDMDTVMLLEVIVKKEGFRVSTARDGQEAVYKIEDEKPDLLLLDLRLPTLGGIEIVRQLQAGQTANIPVIIVTGHSGDHGMVQMIRKESNVVGFFEKPVKHASLGMNLHTLLKTRPPSGTTPLPGW